jgi:hypothetical protein
VELQHRDSPVCWRGGGTGGGDEALQGLCALLKTGHAAAMAPLLGEALQCLSVQTMVELAERGAARGLGAVTGAAMAMASVGGGGGGSPRVVSALAQCLRNMADEGRVEGAAEVAHAVVQAATGAAAVAVGAAYSDEKGANRREGGRSCRRFATPADFPLPDCSPYSHVHVSRESLGFVPLQGPFTVAPVPNPTRYDSRLSHRCTAASGGAGGDGGGGGGGGGVGTVAAVEAQLASAAVWAAALVTRGTTPGQRAEGVGVVHALCMLGDATRARLAAQQVLYSDAKVANRDVRDSGWERSSRGRDAAPADSPLHDGTPYRRLRVRRWGLSIVQGPFSVAPCPNPKVTIRNCCIAVQVLPALAARLQERELCAASHEQTLCAVWALCARSSSSSSSSAPPHAASETHLLPAEAVRALAGHLKSGTDAGMEAAAGALATPVRISTRIEARSDPIEA